MPLNSMESIPEMKSLLQWLGRPPRSPLQTHGLNESDCEMIRLPGLSGSPEAPHTFLASTVDSISDEIAAGLYRDPFTMGWVTAQASLSDLAAVGSHPLGLLFSAQWNPSTPEDFKKKVAQGFNSALEASQSYLLGGDSGAATSTVLTSVGLGICKTLPVSRRGLKPGDSLFITGRTGRGPALAFRLLRNEIEEAFSEHSFRPQARLRWGQLLAGVATSMIDTSDGLLAALDTLRLINGVGLELEWNPNTLDPMAVHYCTEREIPLWLLWLGEHGDFELLVSIPSDQLEQARQLCPELHFIGRAVEDPTLAELKISPEYSHTDKTECKKIDFKMMRCIESGRKADLKNLSDRLRDFIQLFKEEEFP